jgi:hypothetical protein
MKNLLLLSVLMLFMLNASAYLFVAEGYVIDLQGTPIQNHPVKSLANDPDAKKSTLTDVNGFFRLEFQVDGAQQLDILVYTQSVFNGSLQTKHKLMKSFNGTNEVNFELGYDINQSIDCQADFLPLIVAGNHTLALFNTSHADSVVAYHWDFGDGSQSTESNPIHNFSPNNRVFITLKISTLDNCYSSRTYLINFDEDPNDDLTVNLNSIALPSGYACFFQPQAGPGTYFFYHLPVKSGKINIPHVPQNQTYLWVIPDLQTNEFVYPTYLPTYSASALKWQQADEWNFMTPLAQISLLDFPDPYFGNGQIEVQVIRNDRKHLKADSLFLLNPLGIGTDADVVYRIDSVYTPCALFLENGMHQTIAFQQPDENGFVKFDHLPSGTYYIRTELFRKSSQSAEIILADTSSLVQGIVFTILDDEILVEVPENKQIVDPLLFPNPTAEYLQMDHLNSEFELLQLISPTGQRVLSAPVIGKNNHTLAVGALPKGVYMMILTGSGKTISKKIVII